MAYSALVTSMSLDSNDTIYSYNECPTHHFIKEEPNDADSNETPYSSDKEAAPEVNPNNHPIATSPLAHINAQLEEIRVKMVEHPVQPKPKPYVPIQDPPAEA
ncbi:uncharacterized protein G2W53_039869 [Senna tora]|uniref:Uncharacterized protein n=1 Tax=Senna tora TaxID=362788 RepID=A0A834W3Y1_9FABA|nr:uncharacterized protein G2W53_039869 [Senna tora]